MASNVKKVSLRSIPATAPLGGGSVHLSNPISFLLHFSKSSSLLQCDIYEVVLIIVMFGSYAEKEKHDRHLTPQRDYVDDLRIYYWLWREAKRALTLFSACPSSVASDLV